MTGKRRDWYISLYVNLYPKKIAVNKHGSLLNGRHAEILTERHTDDCNLPENAPRKKVN